MTTQNEGGLSDFIRQILELEPNLAFQGALSGSTQRTGRTAPIRRFFQGRFDDVFNEFIGQLGSQIQRNPNALPETSFSDFLQGSPARFGPPKDGDRPLLSAAQPGFNFEDRFFSRAPNLRGQFNSQFAPSTRFLNF
jgi:hypothetical protein